LNDIVPLRARLGALFVLRLALGIAVLGLLGAAAVPVPEDVTVIIVAAHLLVAVVVEAVRQLRGRLPGPTVAATVLLDCVFIAGVVTVSGGPLSAAGFLLYAHLIAVTLLVSYRTGLKVAVWQSLLLVVAHYLPPSLTGVAPMPVTETVLAMVAFLTVALVTAACSSINERELRRSRTGFAALAGMGGRMEDAHNPDEVVTELLRSIADAFGYGRAAVVLHEPPQVVVAEGTQLTTTAMAAPVITGVVARALDQRGTVLTASLDPAADAALDHALPNARNLVVLPLTADGEGLGTLVVERGGSRGARIHPSTVALLAQFAAHAALAYRNVRLLAEIKHLAAVDALTGLANRRTFEAALQREVARAGRSKEPLSLVLLDIDHFKQINDTHGHPMGDEVLRHVGRALADAGREQDLGARYGGEEFAVVLPNCPADEAVRVADRLRAAVSAGAPLPVTASAGTASLHVCATDAETLVKAADAALYQAKVNGRDRTVAAGGRLQVVSA